MFGKIVVATFMLVVAGEFDLLREFYSLLRVSMQQDQQDLNKIYDSVIALRNKLGSITAPPAPGGPRKHEEKANG